MTGECTKPAVVTPPNILIEGSRMVTLPYSAMRSAESAASLAKSTSVSLTRFELIEAAEPARRVDRHRYAIEMRWIPAGTVSAEMVDDIFLAKNKIVGPLVRQTMHEAALAFVANLAVTLAVVPTLPTEAWRDDVEVLLETVTVLGIEVLAEEYHALVFWRHDYQGLLDPLLRHSERCDRANGWCVQFQH